MDALTVKDSTPSKRETYNSVGAAPGTNITVLVYGEFENLLEIESNGAVLYDIYQR